MEPELALQGHTCLFHDKQTGCNLHDVILEHLWFTCMTASEMGKLGQSLHDVFKVWGQRALVPNLPGRRLILEIPTHRCVSYTSFSCRPLMKVL